MTVNQNLKKVIFFVLLLACLTPYVTAPIALLLGFAMAITFGNPYISQSSVMVKWLLKAAVIGLGFGMNFYSAAETGKAGMLFTVTTILLVLSLGYLLGKLLKVNPKTSYLISSGTAICGGSAIAAVAPITGAENKHISVALGTVFILNAAALLLFPLIGHLFELTQYQFGLWSAIAIHDTSSVVGAASAYGNEALEVATTVKLGRALWIIPLSLFTVAVNRKNTGKVYMPYFIFLFILAMVVSTMLPQYYGAYNVITAIAKKALIITLFLIGTGLSAATIKSVGAKVFVQGMVLWMVISVVSLVTILLIY